MFAHTEDHSKTSVATVHGDRTKICCSLLSMTRFLSNCYPGALLLRSYNETNIRQLPNEGYHVKYSSTTPQNYQGHYKNKSECHHLKQSPGRHDNQVQHCNLIGDLEHTDYDVMTHTCNPTLKKPRQRMQCSGPDWATKCNAFSKYQIKSKHKLGGGDGARL